MKIGPQALVLLSVVLLAAPGRAQTWEAALRAGAADAGAGVRRLREASRCLEFGRHADSLPAYDTMQGSRGCLRDPFEAPGSFESAWTALIARVRRDGGARVPYSTPFENGFQQAVSAGLASPERLNGRDYWGDFAVLFLQEDGSSTRGLTIVTYRAYLSREPGADRIKAVRMDFSAYADGTLETVEYRDGELSADGSVMMWAPVRIVGQRDWMSGVYEREWRQLVDAMSAGSR